MWINIRLFLFFLIGQDVHMIEQKKFHLKSIYVEQNSLDLALVKTFLNVRSALACALMTRGLKKFATNYNDNQECIVYDETLLEETEHNSGSLVYLLYIPEPDYQYITVDFEHSCPNWNFVESGMVLEYTLELNQCALIEGLRGADAFPINTNIVHNCAHQFWHSNDTKIRAKISPDFFELHTQDNCDNGNMTFQGFHNIQTDNDPENKSGSADDLTFCSRVSSSKVLEAFDNPRIEFFKYGGNLNGKGVNFTVCAVSIA
ncbi:uncharacterized protein LOC131882071 isoform X2 [Tigriopus californicus]|nr:uncharacterized protein LOC131882071 isoform X2 [Tigriopus californicus]